MLTLLKSITRIKHVPVLLNLPTRILTKNVVVDGVDVCRVPNLYSRKCRDHVNKGVFK